MKMCLQTLLEHFSTDKYRAIVFLLVNVMADLETLHVSLYIGRRSLKGLENGKAI